MLKLKPLVSIARLALLGILLLVHAACAPAEDAAARAVSADDPLRVVTTIQPLKLIVRDLIGEELAEFVALDALLAPEQSPHGFEPSPSQMAQLQRADVVIINGLGLDDWAQRAAKRGARIVVFSDSVGIDAHDHHHHHHHDDDHECDHHHGPVDEHLWLDPILVKRFASHCANALTEALEGASDLDRIAGALDVAAARFAKDADDVDGQYRQELQAFSGRRIVTHHNVFSRVAERYGLGDPIVLRPLAVLEPTPGDLRRAIEAIREDGITTVFIEPQFHAAAAERIRDETGVELVLIDPHGAQASSWPAFMRELLDALVKGLDGEQ